MSTTRMVAAQGWRFARNGQPDKVLRQEKFRIPFDRRGGQVVVKMLAAPVHAHDKNYIFGNYGDIKPAAFPAVGGTEGAGIVEEVGAAAKLGVREGDLVWINKQNVGTWATHVVTDAENVDVMPNRADVDIEFLASMTTFHTAWHLVHSTVPIGSGDVVLQTGASSSVAQVCMGLVRARGGKLIQAMRTSRAEHNRLITRFKTMGAFAVVPYSYLRTKYMRRLLSDLPPPKLLLNHSGGHEASQLVKFLGDNGVCVTYGSMSGRPLQVANLDLMRRGIEFRGFWLPKFQERQSREARMRVHQNVIENITLASGQASFRCTRYKMDGDAPFAFSNAWDSPFVNRKSILRMVGEYGEWRRPRPEVAQINLGRALWEDMLQQLYEQTGATDTPASFKYYTPFGDWHSDFQDAANSKEMGHRESFFRRPNAPRHNAAEVIAQAQAAQQHTK
jgi:NADPH:quinone reductase-like Zn-dependent oxidoreductase